MSYLERLLAQLPTELPRMIRVRAKHEDGTPTSGDLDGWAQA